LTGDGLALFAGLPGREGLSVPLIFSRFIPTPENRSALAAVHNVCACLRSDHSQPKTNPLYLHGPPGTGKTHLVSALVEEVTRRAPRLIVTIIQAADFQIAHSTATKVHANQEATLDPAQETDLLVVEDLQHLAVRPSHRAAVVEQLVQVMDYLAARQRQMVFTANTGPARIANLPARLVSRLAAGLVVGLEPLGPAGRLAFLQDKAQRRQLVVSRDVLAWLADHLPGGGRQLVGALVQLDSLSRMHSRRLDVAVVAEHFRSLVEASHPTVERIAERVGNCFQVTPRELQSARRSRSILMPRHVSMYLARQLTNLSLQQIGAYFGGRDHSTVLHACHKVERALDRDTQLSGVVRHLHAELR
jgi:chromosomal replication initiator protein